MWQLYVCSLVAGILATNGLPHFIKGLFGEKHQTPFGHSSSPVVNIVWGWVNIVVAGAVFHYAHPRNHELKAAIMFMIGVLLIGIVIASTPRVATNKK